MATATPAPHYVRLNALMDTGRVRDHNEDNFIVCPDLRENVWYVDEKPTPLSPLGCLLVVADGMGGANAGEVASELAVERVRHLFASLSLPGPPTEKQAREHLARAIHVAHEAIVAHAAAHPECEGMGTTIVMAWVLADKAVVAWCGDSRGYLYRPGEALRMVTRDHSLVWELVEAGQLSPDEADAHPKSNFITQNLGNPQAPPEPDLAVVPLQPADRLLLCSDGLNNMLASPAIEKIVAQPKALDEVSRELIGAANEKGGKDNITVVLLEVMAQSPAPSPQPQLRPRWALVTAGIALTALLLLAAGWWMGKRGKPAAPAVPVAAGNARDVPRSPVATPGTPGTIVNDNSAAQTPAPAPGADRPGQGRREPRKEVLREAVAPPAPDAQWDTFLDRVVAVVGERDKIVLGREADPEPAVADTGVRRYFEADLPGPDSGAAAGPKDKMALLHELDALLARADFREWARKWRGGAPKARIRQEAIGKWDRPEAFEAEIKKAEALLADISKAEA